MPEHPQWFVGDRNPAIADTVSIGGVGVDLTTKTTTFKMRAFNSETLKVNQAVSTKDANGNWTYNWDADDLDTAGKYFVWVTVDMGGGALATVNEDTIIVAEHGPGDNAYMELEELKSTLEVEGHRGSDQDIRAAILSASRIVDELTGRRFYLDADANQIRYYTPRRPDRLWIDDLVTLTEFAYDPSGGTTFGSTWTVNTDFVFEPLNAVADGRPWEEIIVANGSSGLPCGYPRSVRITGKFGWLAVPEAVRVATGIIATKLVKRSKDAPMGVLTFFDGSAVRMSRFDPQVEELLADYTRPRVVG